MESHIVTMTLKAGLEVKDYNAIAAKESLAPLEVEIKRLEEISKSILHDLVCNVHVDVSEDVCVDVCVGVCVGVCVDISVDAFVDAWVDVGAWVCSYIILWFPYA